MSGQTTESDQQALIKALHAERTEANSLHVDCWACEAAQSKTIADLMDALRRAQSANGAAQAVLEMAVPDENERHDLWRKFWRGQLSEMRQSPGQSEATDA